MRRRDIEPTVEAVATTVGFDLDDVALADCREAVSTFETLADELEKPPDAGRPTGHRSDDPHGALLAVYDDPRGDATSGQLAGRRVAVKDNVSARGLEMTCGSADFSIVPDFDATVVERLLAAGARLVGKANMEPFALGPTGEYSDHGRVANPTLPDRVPGGSSSGSAAAVAGDLVDVALGSDTGGSVRIPAACCGLVGIKPTHGVVPGYGFVELAPSLDTVGPIARDVDTAARTLAAIVGHDPRDPTSRRSPSGRLDEDPPDDLTVGVPRPLIEPAQADIAAVIEDVVADLDQRGDVSVRRIDLDLDGVIPAFLHTVATEFAWLLRGSGIVRGRGTGYAEPIRAAVAAMRDRGGANAHVARRILPAAVVDARRDGRAYVAARRAALAFRERLLRRFEDVDVLLSPTLRMHPPGRGRFASKEDGLRSLAGNTIPFSLAGGPAVTLPVGRADGIPVSAQLAAPPFGDWTAVAVARLVERVVVGR